MDIKLSFSTLSFENLSVEQLAVYCKKYGIRGIEIREGQDAIVTVNTDKCERQRVLGILRNAGVIVINIGSGICIKGINDKERLIVEKQARDICKLAADMGAKGYRVFLGNFASRRDIPKDELDYSGIVESLQNICDYSAKYDIEVWIETHNEFATGKILKKLLEDVNMPNCKIIWDIIHSLEEGEQPEDTLSYIGKRCAHVHIKDGVPSNDLMVHDWEYTLIGRGKVRIRKIVRLLMEHGYEGFFSLEWEEKWKQELRKLNIGHEQIIAEYQTYMNLHEQD